MVNSTHYPINVLKYSLRSRENFCGSKKHKTYGLEYPSVVKKVARLELDFVLGGRIVQVVQTAAA